MDPPAIGGAWVVPCTSMLLAHQGGWDEIVMVIAPVGLFSLLLWVANRRAAKLVGVEDGEPATDEPFESP